MLRVSEDVVNVVGDSLVSCMYSRYLASLPHIKQVNHYTTGEYGGFYFDRKKDSSFVALFLSKHQIDEVRKLLPEAAFIPLSESYLKAPVKKIKFSSPYDEYIPYPITKSSFELDMDYHDCVLKTYSKAEFLEEYASNKNITKLMKSVFSETMYMNLMKKIGCNQWGMNQSQMDARSIYALLSLEQLGNDNQMQYYYPANGASKLCIDMLSDSKIKIIEMEPKKIKKEIKANSHIVSHLFDYIDYYMDFMFGGLDYVSAKTEIHSKSISEYRYFRVLTPFDKTHYMYFGVEAVSYKVSSVPMLIRSNSFGRGVLCPSQANYRKIADYRKVSAVSRNLKVMI